MLEQLEQVRAFRSEVPPPSETAVQTAREELMRAIHGEPFPHAHAAAPRATVRQARLRRRWGVRLALGAALAGAGVVLAGLLGSPTVTAPPSALAAAMSRLAHVAESQQWGGIPGPGQYLYTESEGLSEVDTMAASQGVYSGTGSTARGPAPASQECQVQLVEHRKRWIATDGSGAISQSYEDARFTSAADEERCVAMSITDPSSQAQPWSNSFPAGGLSFPTKDWHALSTDPARLLVQLRKLDGGPHDPGEDFVHIGDFMRESDAPPAIRAALYEAAALIPGVRLMGSQSDPTGRSGLAVGFPYPNGQINSELIFDQQSGKLLAEETFGPEGKLDDWTAYLQSKIVDSHPDYPES